jgi:dockerin type I repeat protein
MSLFSQGKLPGWLSIAAVAGVALCGFEFSLLADDAGGGAVTSFKRGDANIDGKINIADVIAVIMSTLGTKEMQCKDAADADDSGAVNIADAVYLANYYFKHGPPPPAPFPACGADPTGTDTLDCGAYAACQ